MTESPNQIPVEPKLARNTKDSETNPGLDIEVTLEQHAEKFVEKELGRKITSQTDKKPEQTANDQAPSSPPETGGELTDPTEIANQLKDAEKKVTEADAAYQEAATKPEGQKAQELTNKSRAKLEEATTAFNQQDYQATAGLSQEAIQLANQAIQLARTLPDSSPEDTPQEEDRPETSKDQKGETEESKTKKEKTKEAQASAKNIEATAKNELEKQALQGVAKKALWMNPAFWVIIIDVLIGILVVIVAMSFLFRQSSPRPPDPVQHVEDDHRIADLLRLAGDLKAREQLLGETTREICDALENVKQYVTTQSPKLQAKAEPKILAAEQAVNQLLAALNRPICGETAPSASPTPTTTAAASGKKQLAPVIIKLRDATKKAIDELLAIINGSDCTNLGAPNKVGHVAFPESANYKLESAQKWGKPRFVCAIIHIIADYKALYPNKTVILHDSSGEFGNWTGNRHLSHIHGNDIDIWFQGATLNNRWNPGLPAEYDSEKAKKLAEIVAKYRYGNTWIGFDDCAVAGYAKTFGFHLGEERQFPTFECETEKNGFGDHTTHWHIGFRSP